MARRNGPKSTARRSRGEQTVEGVEVVTRQVEKPGTGLASTDSKEIRSARKPLRSRAQVPKQHPASPSRTAMRFTAEDALTLVVGGASKAVDLATPTDTNAFTPVRSSESDIGNEVKEGAPSLGDFVRAVGLAVADAQTKLDETFVKTAQGLSNQQIDVIAVFEQEIDDNGQMTAGTAHKAKMPLSAFVPLSAHQFSRVYMQADMKVAEFNSANGMNIHGGSTTFNANAKGSYGLFGLGVSGGTNFSTNSYNQSVGTSNSTDSAAGSLHLEATIEPRPEIQPPRPLILQKGPRLKVSAGPRREIKGEDGKAIAREVSLTVELRSKANNPLSGKRIELKVSPPLINYTVTPDTMMTPTDGTLSVTLRREGSAFDPNKPPEPVSINVWFGLVNESIAVDL